MSESWISVTESFVGCHGELGKQHVFARFGYVAEWHKCLGFAQAFVDLGHDVMHVTPEFV